MPSLFASGEFIFEYPTIYGVATNQRLLGFIHSLSKHPDFHVECYDDLLDYDQKSHHLNYVITLLDDGSQCILIKNRGSSSLYYPKYNNVAYLLCSLNENEINPEIIEIFSKLPDISLCFALEKPNQNQILNFIQIQ
tara:strand:+ start:1755 stop:2165 length:411 start_codon:yes stop_codon:yes gene_type:complete